MFVPAWLVLVMVVLVEAVGFYLFWKLLGLIEWAYDYLVARKAYFEKESTK